jgi:hypothetical protein
LATLFLPGKAKRNKTILEKYLGKSRIACSGKGVSWIFYQQLSFFPTRAPPHPKGVPL